MFARLSAFVIWALVAATVVFWVLRLVVHPFEVPSQAMAVAKSSGVRGDLTRLLGSAPVVAAATAAAPPEASSRFKLIGVMAPKSRGGASTGDYGLALIAVDGKPARAYAVGASVDSGLVLQSVGMRSASIVSQQGAPMVTLELPPLAEPATGRLGAVTAGPVPPAVPTPSTSPSAMPTRQMPSGMPPNIATLPQASGMQTMPNFGQPPNGAVPLRQPAPVQDTAVPSMTPASSTTM